MEEVKVTKKLGITEVILIVHLILKVGGVVDWPWRIVLWPLWYYAVLILGGMLYAIYSYGRTDRKGASEDN